MSGDKDMPRDEPCGASSSCPEGPIDPRPFFMRCDHLSEQWDGLRDNAQRSGNRSNFADLVLRIAALVFAAAATAVSTLVAADVTGELLSSSTSAILAALARIG